MPKRAAGTFLLLALYALLCMGLFQGCSSFDPAREYFEQAEAMLGEGDYTGALEKYSYVTSNHQGSPYAPKSQYMIAFINNRHLSDEKKALDEYSTLFYLYPKSPEVLLAREDIAVIHSRSGEHVRAIEEYEKLIHEKPKDRERLQYLVAMEYIKMNDFTQARIELQGIAKETLNAALKPKLYYEIAYTYYIEGELTRALHAYDDIIADYPSHEVAVDAELGKAKVLEESGRLGDALEVLGGLKGRYPNEEAIDLRMKWIEKRIKEGPPNRKGAR